MSLNLESSTLIPCVFEKLSKLLLSFPKALPNELPIIFPPKPLPKKLLSIELLFIELLSIELLSIELLFIELLFRLLDGILY